MGASFKDSLKESNENETEYDDPDRASRKKDQDQARLLRIWSIIILYGTLATELVFVGALLVLQGFKIGAFHLHVTIFTVLISGVIIQTFGLMVIVFKYLFGGIPYK